MSVSTEVALVVEGQGIALAVPVVVAGMGRAMHQDDGMPIPNTIVTIEHQYT